MINLKLILLILLMCSVQLQSAAARDILDVFPLNTTEKALEDAKQGDPNDQFYLGNMYCKGSFFVDQNLPEAAKWFLKAAKQGNADAQSKIGAMYIVGIGVEMNKIKGYEWSRKAAAQGHQGAQGMLETSVRRALGLVSNWLC
jgi:TPR repeat protein